MERKEGPSAFWNLRRRCKYLSFPAWEEVSAHLRVSIDGLSEPDVLLVLGASVPVLLGDALRLGIDAGLAGGEVAEDLDGIVGAALVGVNPVESCRTDKRESS